MVEYRDNIAMISFLKEFLFEKKWDILIIKRWINDQLLIDVSAQIKLPECFAKKCNIDKILLFESFVAYIFVGRQEIRPFFPTKTFADKV